MSPANSQRLSARGAGQILPEAAKLFLPSQLRPNKPETLHGGENTDAILAIMSGRMAFLKENSEAIKAIAARHKGLKIAVFGSVARGEDTEISDIDFLVTFDKEVSVLDWLLLNEELEQFLKIPVDVVSIKGLKSRDTRILQEAVLL